MTLYNTSARYEETLLQWNKSSSHRLKPMRKRKLVRPFTISFSVFTHFSSFLFRKSFHFVFKLSSFNLFFYFFAALLCRFHLLFFSFSFSFSLPLPAYYSYFFIVVVLFHLLLLLSFSSIRFFIQAKSVFTL